VRAGFLAASLGLVGGR